MAESDVVTLMRQNDLDRWEAALRQLSDGQNDLKSRVTDIRVLLAEAYVTKKEHDGDIVSVKLDVKEALAMAKKDSDDENKLLRQTLAEHTVSDDARFTEIRRLLYGLIGGMLLIMGTLIAELLVGFSHHTP